MMEYLEIIVGYWRRREDGKREQFHQEDSHLPWPKAGQLTEMEVCLALSDLSYLESRPDVETIQYRGYSGCRLCGRMNGSREFALPIGGTMYRWPEGLRHYIAEHRVALPKELKDLL